MFACGVEEQRDFGGGASEAAEKSTRGHGADENAGVARVALHTNTVAENCAAGVGAGGVHGDNSDSLVLLAMLSGETIDQRALSRAGGAGDAGEIGCAGLREKNFQQGLGLRGGIFDRGDAARNGPNFSSTALLLPFLN